MPNLTENYSLIMPLQEETYDVGIFNENIKKIDAILKEIEQRSMPALGDTIITTSGTNPSVKYAGTKWRLLDGGYYIKTAGAGINAGSVGGNDNISLSMDNMPPHNHGGTIYSSGNHYHNGTTDASDLSGDFRCRSNTFYGRGVDSVIGTATTAGKFSVRQSGLRSEGNADDNRTEYICHFDGNHNHSFTTNWTGEHVHGLTINSAGGGKAFTINPKYVSFYIWVRIE